MTWPVGIWLGLAVFATSFSVFLVTLVIGDTFTDWRLHFHRKGRSVYWYWGSGEPPWSAK